ncbi:MAG: UTP--glucose-1-phosphate uridylyltransferase, partial [Burkholderiales bacterium]|nr:UTP--glucose-1-phosphate uridylyltransferase [Burkholderiales bacterium]
LTGQPLIGDVPFGVVLADDLCLNPGGPGVLAQMVELFRQFRCSIVAVQDVPRADTASYGIVEGESIRGDVMRVTRMVEKPQPEDAPSTLAIIGRYILTPDIFGLIESTPPGRNGEIQLTDALNEQARRGCVIAYRFKGQRFDCGSVAGYVEATNHVYQAGHDLSGS